MKKYILSTAGILLLAVTTIASSEGPAHIQEVIVSATRIEQSLQDIPIAVHAVSGEEIEAFGISDGLDLFNRVPGIATHGLGKHQPAYGIRGVVSTQEGASSDTSVAFYQDGVFISRFVGMSGNFFDLSQVEVLKGPQGTMFGKNAAGGAIQLITNAPTEELEGHLRAEFGDYNHQKYEMVLSGPLSDSLSGRVGVRYRKRDGFTEEITSGDDIDFKEELVIRGALKYSGENLDINVRAEHAEDDDGWEARAIVGPELFSGFPFLPPTGPDQDVRKVRTTFANQGGYEREIDMFTLQIDYAISDSLSLTSITAHREVDMHVLTDLFVSNMPRLFQLSDDVSKQLTQEFRLVGNPSSSLNWQAGIFVANEEVERGGNIYVARLPSPGPFDDFAKNETNSLGIYGSLTADVTDKGSLIFGLRYSRDEKEESIDNGFVAPELNNEWSKVTWDLSYFHSLNEDVSVYTKYAQGYKPGGFNDEAGSVDEWVSFDEEFVQSYELGLKSYWLDRSIQLNGSIFFMVYEDIQFESFINQTLDQAIANVGEMQSQGVEAELLWAATNNLGFNVSIAYNDAEITEFEPNPALEGNQFYNTPELSYVLGITYDLPLNNGSEFRMMASFRHKDKVFSDLQNNLYPYRVGEEMDVVDLNANWSSPEKQWQVAAWVRNLTDQESWAQIVPDLGAFDRRNGSATFSAPRTFGLDFTYNF